MKFVIVISLLLSLLPFQQAYAHDLQNVTIGDGYGVQVKEGRTTDDELDKIKRAGLGYVRFVIPWAEVEKKQGVYSWGYFETFISRLRQRGLKAVVVLGGGHPAYTGYIKAPDDNLDKVDRLLTAPRTQEAVDGFVKFAVKTAEKFSGDDIVWELWNEPDSDRFWAPKANAQDYIRLAAETCQQIKKAVPHSFVVGPALADFPGYYSPAQPSFMDPILKSDLLGCFDAISLHPYRDGDAPPETVLASYEKFKAHLQYIGIDKKKYPRLVSTEWGFTLTDFSQEEQAAFLVRSFLLNSLAGVPLSIWYEWRDARVGKDDSEAHFGLLTYHKKEKKAYTLLSSFLPPLVGAVIESRIPTGHPDDFILLLKKKDGRYSFVVWSAQKETRTRLFVRSGCDAGAGIVSLSEVPDRIDCGVDRPGYTVFQR